MKTWDIAINFETRLRIGIVLAQKGSVLQVISIIDFFRSFIPSIDSADVFNEECNVTETCWHVRVNSLGSLEYVLMKDEYCMSNVFIVDVMFLEKSGFLNHTHRQTTSYVIYLTEMVILVELGFCFSESVNSRVRFFGP